MLKKIKSLLKRVTPVYNIYVSLRDSERGTTSLNVLREFAAYKPNSSGSYKDRSSLTISTIKNIFPSLERLGAFSGITVDETESPEEFFNVQSEDLLEINRMASLFNHYGSDKSTTHDYHRIYAPILCKLPKAAKIIEIGLGTNNTDVVSTMGCNGIPGASLRAFRDFCPKAKIYGADIDSRILFNEERIETFYVDQLSTESLQKLASNVGSNFDLVIDDGLHSPDANVNTLLFGLSVVKTNGWVVIEDIGTTPCHRSIWLVIASLIDRKKFKPVLFRSLGGVLVFAVQKIN